MKRREGYTTGEGGNSPAQRPPRCQGAPPGARLLGHLHVIITAAREARDTNGLISCLMIFNQI